MYMCNCQLHMQIDDLSCTKALWYCAFIMTSQFTCKILIINQQGRWLYQLMLAFNMHRYRTALIDMFAMHHAWIKLVLLQKSKTHYMY